MEHRTSKGSMTQSQIQTSRIDNLTSIPEQVDSIENDSLQVGDVAAVAIYCYCLTTFQKAHDG